MKKVFFITFGCKVNQYETECMKAAFSADGYDISCDYRNADVIVVNSCTVTSSGDSRAVTALRKLRTANPEAIIALTGCYPQAFREQAVSITDADIVIGTKDRSSLLPLINDFQLSHRREIALSDYSPDDKYECITCTEFKDNTRAFVKIQDGCNQFCSYCIIPFARGRCRSKPIEILKQEISGIAANGVKEIVLSGINLAFYGKEFGLNLADAVEVCCGIDGIERVRLGSLEPEMMSDNILDRLAAQPKLCPQFHLSLQSGCDRTLKAMNRHYDCNMYSSLVQRIRLRFPDCAFTTDVMVGFPDESDDDFLQSLSFVKNIGFAKTHVFRYSRRKGTVADSMPNQIHDNIKSLRYKQMSQTAAKCEAAYLSSLVGKTVRVLFERENSPDFHQGHADDYSLIKIPREKCKKSLRNQLFCVRINKSDCDCCYGTVVRDKAASET